MDDALTVASRRAATPNPYVPVQVAASRKLPAAAIEENVARLSKAPSPSTLAAKLLEPVCVSPVLPAHAVAASVKRLYTESVAVGRQKHAALLNKTLTDHRPHRTLTPEDESDSVQRLYYASVQAHRDRLQALRRQHLINFEPRRDVLAPEKSAHAVQHLYVQEKERAAERAKKLQQLYVAPTEPKVARRSDADINSMLSRLHMPKRSSS